MVERESTLANFKQWVEIISKGSFWCPSLYNTFFKIEKKWSYIFENAGVWKLEYSFGNNFTPLCLKGEHRNIHIIEGAIMESLDFEATLFFKKCLGNEQAIIFYLNWFIVHFLSLFYKKKSALKPRDPLIAHPNLHGGAQCIYIQGVPSSPVVGVHFTINVRYFSMHSVCAAHRQIFK